MVWRSPSWAAAFFEMQRALLPHVAATGGGCTEKGFIEAVGYINGGRADDDTEKKSFPHYLVSSSLLPGAKKGRNYVNSLVATAFQYKSPSYPVKHMSFWQAGLYRLYLG
jgi:hypothetical protein